MTLPANAAVTLDIVKAQANQTQAFDDALLERKIIAAQGHLESMLGYTLLERHPSVEGGAQYPDTVPAPLIEAICELAAWWYAQREAALVGTGTTATAVPLGFDDIVANFRDYSWGEDDAA